MHLGWDPRLEGLVAVDWSPMEEVISSLGEVGEERGVG